MSVYSIANRVQVAHCHASILRAVRPFYLRSSNRVGEAIGGSKRADFLEKDRPDIAECGLQIAD